MRKGREGTFEIADAVWQDDHHCWQIDFVRMTATFWTEGADDEWSGQAYPLRRTVDGRWEYYEDQDRWEAHVASRQEGLQVRSAERIDRFPPFIAADLLLEGVEAERQLKEVERRGPSWLAFTAEMSDEIESEWNKRHGSR